MGARVEVSHWRWMRTLNEGRAVTGNSSTPLSFALAPGDRVLVRGRSGSGKSTLLAALAGLIHTQSNLSVEGEIVVDGVAAALRPCVTGLLLQDPSTSAVMPTIGDDVAFGLENLGVPSRDMADRITESLAAVGLELPLDAPTDRLSGGQRQRLALAGVVAMRPQLLLLDEPTANLDPTGARLIRDAVERIVREHHITLVVVDHTPDFWSGIVDREIHISDSSPDMNPPVVSPRTRRPVSKTRAISHAGTPLLTVDGLSVGYPRAGVAQTNVSCVVRSGRVLAVTGPNGSGKSAFALTLGGLIPAREGSISLAEPTTRVGLVFQTPEHQFIGSTVRADVAAGIVRRRGEHKRNQKREFKRDRDARVNDALSEFHLEHLAGRHPYDISGGEKRRLSIADIVAGMQDDVPGILVLDEPSTGQDEQTWHDLVASLRSLAEEGHGLVVITHDERLVAALDAERVRFSS